MATLLSPLARARVVVVVGLLVEQVADDPLRCDAVEIVGGDPPRVLTDITEAGGVLALVRGTMRSGAFRGPVEGEIG